MPTTSDSVNETVVALAAKGVYAIALPTPFPVGPVIVYVIDRDGPILFDTGLKTDESLNLLRTGLADLGWTFPDLKAIVVTHGHRDHIGALGQIQKESQAPVYAHPIVRKQGLQPEEGGAQTKQFYIDIMQEFGVPASIIEEANSLFDRYRSYWEAYTVAQTVEDESEWLGFKAYYVPGHSPSDTLFADHEAGITVSGDHILEGTNVNPLLRRPEPGETRAKSLVEYQASLRRTRSLSLGTCLPGHGGPIRDHIAVVDDILARQQRRSERVLELVRTGCHTPYAVSAELFPKLEHKHLHLGLSMTVGHMEVLEDAGALSSGHENGVLLFEVRTE